MREWLITRLQKWSIAKKIFIATFLLVELMNLLFVYAYYQHSASVLLQAGSDNASLMVNKSDEYLQLNLTNVQYSFYSILHDSRFLTGSPEELEDWLGDNSMFINSNIKYIHIIQGDSVLFSSSPYGWTLLDDPFVNDRVAQLQQDEQIHWIGPYFSHLSQYTVTAAMKAAAPDGSPRILVMDIDLQRLYDVLFPAPSYKVSGQLLILDRNNEVVFGRPPLAEYDVFQRKYKITGLEPDLFQYAWTQTRSWSPDHRELFLTRSSSNSIGWQLIWATDKSQLLVPLKQTLRYVWMLALLSLASSAVIAYAMSIYVSRPIRHIATSMTQFSSGQLEMTISMPRKDELGLLADRFNEMTAGIRSLINDLKSTQEKKKNSDYRALQAQIKPHFIFNTLNSIHVSARKGDLPLVEGLISALSQQLHYSLESHSDIISLREELQVLDSYIQLMTMRYPGKFSLVTDMDAATLECRLPKFILQPIVENAIFHGLVPKAGVGTLFVGTSMESPYWHILIQDDGVGMNEAKTAALRVSVEREEEQRSAADSIGLRNVHQRLKLSFGTEYSMTIESSPASGTRILISLPIIFETEGKSVDETGSNADR